MVVTFLALCFFLYFAPAVVASSRNHTSSTAIWVLNAFLGWTVVGWVLLLIWAFAGRREVLFYPAIAYGLPMAAPGRPPGWQANGAAETERICAACYRPLAPSARYCSMCGGNTSLVA